MANNIMNIMSVSFNSQAELEDFLNRVKGKDDDGEKDFFASVCCSYAGITANRIAM